MDFKDDKAIFVQIAEAIENDILRGILLADERAPSTNELAALHGINPNTAAKSLTHLMNDGILYKKRGVGMFVSEGAREKILAGRREKFAEELLSPMLREARLLGLTREDIIAMIDEKIREEIE